jgi:hypothetical protein
MNCSGLPAGSETNNETFRQLYELLPTASVHDDDQTKREVGIFRVVFLGLCPDDVCGAK